MADLAEGFSPKQFQLAFAAEKDGIGGGESTDADYKFINIRIRVSNIILNNISNR